MTTTTRITPRETWRAEVANGNTELGFTEWLANENAKTTYLVGIGNVTTYVYCNRQTGAIDLVVAHNSSISSTRDMKFHYADQNHNIQWDLTALQHDINQATEVMNNAIWPAWEFTW